jgi:phosphoribosyl 1,2-cyclic phosphate phosphodiesterase
LERKKIRLTLLGTGDAGGMPRYGCDCARCQHIRAHPEHKRRTASALLEFDDQRYLIDAGLMDIAERFPAGSLNSILLTHFHADHVQGLFHLRWGTGHKIPVHCPKDSSGCGDLFKHPGILDFQALQKYEAFYLGDLKVTPLPLIHSKPTLGYLFEYQEQRIAYLVDTKGLPPKVEALLSNKELDALIIDTSSPPNIDNRNHNNLNETLSIHEAIKPKKTVITHIGHDLDLWLNANADQLPETIDAGYDGYRIFH